jgi:hypothetical protein
MPSGRSGYRALSAIFRRGRRDRPPGKSRGRRAFQIACEYDADPAYVEMQPPNFEVEVQRQQEASDSEDPQGPRRAARLRGQTDRNVAMSHHRHSQLDTICQGSGHLPRQAALCCESHIADRCRSYGTSLGNVPLAWPPGQNRAPLPSSGS